MSDSRTPQPLYTPGDLDGFFGLAIDNLIQFLLILGLCAGVLGFPQALIVGTVIPAAALSVIVGNLFYVWQSQKLSAATGRTDVTALPYGINTVSLFAFVLLVMAPVKGEALARGATDGVAAHTAWQIGLAACFLSGVIEVAGAFVAERVRKLTPRAALLSTLAGIAISFIAIDFAIRTFASPLIALLPLGVILTTYFARVKMPLGLPGGLLAVAVGTAAAWILSALGEPSPVQADRIGDAADMLGLYIPIPVVGDLIAGLTSEITLDYLIPVILPMGLFNALASMQNIESAEAAGDRYPTMPSMVVNGVGSMVAAAFGSCFPTTIYIGHPGWKALGARSGYALLNAVFFAVLALSGATFVINAIVPLEAGIAIVLWIGVIITAQAFQATPREHAPAVALGLFPAIAAWGVLMIVTAVGAASPDIGAAARVLDDAAAFARSGLDLPGLVALSQGFMLTCMVWAAASAHLIDRRFLSASGWVAVGAGLAFFGFSHAGSLTPAGGVYDIGWATGWRWAAGYALCAGFFALMHALTRRADGDHDHDADDDHHDHDDYDHGDDGDDDDDHGDHG